MNHCSCGASFGDFFLHNEPRHAFYPLDERDASLIRIHEIDWPDDLECKCWFAGWPSLSPFEYGAKEEPIEIPTYRFDSNQSGSPLFFGPGNLSGEDETALPATSVWAFISAGDFAVRIAQTLTAYLRKPTSGVRKAMPRIRIRRFGSVLIMISRCQIIIQAGASTRVAPITPVAAHPRNGRIAAFAALTRVALSTAAL